MFSIDNFNSIKKPSKFSNFWSNFSKLDAVHYSLNRPVIYHHENFCPIFMDMKFLVEQSLQNVSSFLVSEILRITIYSMTLLVGISNLFERELMFMWAIIILLEWFSRILKKEIWNFQIYKIHLSYHTYVCFTYLRLFYFLIFHSLFQMNLVCSLNSQKWKPRVFYELLFLPSTCTVSKTVSCFLDFRFLLDLQKLLYF